MDKRYVTIKESISADGLGTPSVSVYFSYCDKEIKCKNCHNKELQKDGVGYYLSLDEIISIIIKKYDFMTSVYGKCKVALVGGEPLAEINREFSKSISTCFPTILYTWRTIEELQNIDTSTYDEIVCGEYLEENRDEDYILGSTNQYIINNKFQKILEYKGDKK